MPMIVVSCFSSNLFLQLNQRNIIKLLLIAGGLLLKLSLVAQNVGIGTNTPLSRLHVEQGNVLFKGPAIFPLTSGPLPVSGTGIRFLWYADKAAFRAGVVTSNVWDADSIGNFSIAIGENSKASANGTVAMGIGSVASGYASSSFGFSSSALGFVSIAMGSGSRAIGSHSLALGSANQALGENSVSLGTQSQANGEQSIAIGKFNLATATSTTAIGFSNLATANYATAFGASTEANKEYATAMGKSTLAKGVAAFAVGNNSVASGDNATALGYFNTASGANAFSTGTNSTASGAYSTAIGRGCLASGNYSTALGNFVSTSGFIGALALGDNSTTTVMQSFVDNGFRARFAGGYRLFTNSAVTIGAFLNAGANSWAALSDVRMKENFLPVDGEVFLKRIAGMPLTTWNYIGQEAKTMRHYGPMAQDFYKAFGRDGFGEIGCDTLINQQDFLGVNLIAIQALEKRTEKISELEKKMEQLERDNALLKEQMNAVLKAIKANHGATED